jgi:agmatine/peptidylarginine deiminase
MQIRKSFGLLTSIVAFLIMLFSCINRSDNKTETQESNYYSQDLSNRTAAEWEPAIGTMVVWPLSVPYKLVVELSRDNHLYTLVSDNGSRNDAAGWYAKWGIDSTHNTFIYTPQGIDSWWTRDWGPSAVFTADGKMMLGDGKYIYSTPASRLGCNDSLFFLYKTGDNKIIKTEVDDNATLPLGRGLNMPVLDLPYINTGGNVMTDGLGTAFSTCILLSENKFYNVPKDTFLKLNKELLGINNYHIISNFEKEGIQHIDCFMKLLDEERILIAEPPINHELYPIYENIIQQELMPIKTPYGRPYEILRIKTAPYTGERLAAYTNSIIVNKVIYVPLFKIKEDSSALKTWRKAMPGYKVKGFEFELTNEPIVNSAMQEHYTTGYGWSEGDALHCRTRAIWDSQMIFISTKRINHKVSAKQNNTVYVTIIDYSNRGLIKERCRLFWRVKGGEDWESVVLNSTGNENHFFGEIPYHNEATSIEYYVSAASRSGREETQPRTAPIGTYQFQIN